MIAAAPLPADALLTAAVACVTVMLGLWLRQLQTRDATSVDAGWSALILGAGLYYAAVGAGAPLQRGLAAALALLWGGRLTLHLIRDRVLSDAGEDGRYRALRDRLGPGAERKLFWVYLLQAALAFYFGLPFLVLAQHEATTLSALPLAGLLVFAIGMAGEWLADRQLARHRSDPRNRGRTCRTGLWRYSRHPNYFCEWLNWLGIGLVGSRAEHGWLALGAPVVMFVLVRFFSGVPFAEIQSLKSRGDDYRDYMRTTNAFFPWFPRDSSKAAA